MKLTIHTYEELDSWVSAFTNREGLNLFVLVGSAGLSKSVSLKQSIDSTTEYIKAGQLTSFQFFKLLYQCRHRNIVLDDIETALKDQKTCKLLMAVCELDQIDRPVAWYGSTKELSYNTGSRTVQIPQKFNSFSRVAIICNDWDGVSTKLAALEDRGYVIFFVPSPEEVHCFVRTWFRDQEIYDFMGDLLGQIYQPSIRHYVKAQKLKSVGMDWKRPLLETLEADRASPEALVRQLADVCELSVAEQIEKFQDLSGKSRATYFRLKKKLGL